MMRLFPQRPIRRNRPAARRLALGLERLETRNLLSNLPWGAGDEDTGEFMLGSVLVTPVLMESDGSIDPNAENWTPQQIADTKAKIADAMTWWEDTLAAQGVVHSLTFEYDFTYADTPVQTGYEPITRVSNDFSDWIDDFFDFTGFNQSSSFSVNIREFNHAQRLAHGANWAFTIFVVDDTNDPDGFFESGGSFFGAFSFAGGRFFVIPAGRPAGTYSHEAGHMFWARDEHSSGGSFTDERGYYDTQNLNAADNPAPGFTQVDSIMASGALLDNAFDDHTSSPTSLEMIGWRDTDGNGVYDLLDVPHELTGTGYFDAAMGFYRFVGQAAVQTLPNLNSSGLQNDITINRVNEAQFRVDGGAWQTAEQYDAFSADLDLRINVPGGFSQIEIRTVTIDPGTGLLVTASPIFTGNPSDVVSTSAAGVSGLVWYDVDNDGNFFGPGETGLAGAVATLVDESGQPLPLQQTVEPDNFNHRETIFAASATFSVVGGDGNVAAINHASASTGGRVFGVFRPSAGAQSSTWSDTKHLRIDFNAPVIAVHIDAIGSGPSSFGRLEIYDAADNLLGRYTTSDLSSGLVETMSLSHDTATVAYAIAKGHADTETLLDQLRIGPQSTASVDQHGAYSLGPLPAGEYTVEITPPAGFNPSQPLSGSASVVVSAGQTVSGVDFAFRPPSLRWQNSANAADVDNDRSVAPIDALGVLNDLIDNGSRILPVIGPLLPPAFVDVDGDGWSAPIDALTVLNFLIAQAAQQAQNGEGESGAGIALVLAGDGGTNDGAEGESTENGSHRQATSLAPAPLACEPRHEIVNEMAMATTSNRRTAGSGELDELLIDPTIDEIAAEIAARLAG